MEPEKTENKDWFESTKKVFINSPTSFTPLSKLSILPKLKKNIRKSGVKELFKIQKNVIKYINGCQENYLTRNRDIGICSPTGSGKTLCYAIPIVQMHLKDIYATSIILAPSVQLCSQITGVIRKLTIHTEIVVTDSETSSKKNVIWVLTPTKIKKYLNEKMIKLHNFKYLVFDEADKLFLDKYGEWQKVLEEKLFKDVNISSIQGWISSHPFIRKIMLSATLSDNPELISNFNLFQPIIFLGTQENSPTLNPLLQEIIYECEPEYKPLLTAHIVIKQLKNFPNNSILCFVNSTQVAKRLFHLLKSYHSLTVMSYYSEMSFIQRKKCLDKFLNNQCNILVSTDSLSRGIDFQHLGLVINYDPPLAIETYLHRVGRTCRGNSEGIAITILTKEQKDFIYSMKKLPRKKEFIQKKSNEEKMDYLNDWYKETIINLND